MLIGPSRLATMNTQEAQRSSSSVFGVHEVMDKKAELGETPRAPETATQRP